MIPIANFSMYASRASSLVVGTRSDFLSKLIKGTVLEQWRINLTRLTFAHQIGFADSSARSSVIVFGVERTQTDACYGDASNMTAPTDPGWEWGARRCKRHGTERLSLNLAQRLDSPRYAKTISFPATLLVIAKCKFPSCLVIYQERQLGLVVLTHTR